MIYSQIWYILTSEFFSRPYLVVEDRETSKAHIVDALYNIEKNIRSIIPNLKTQVQVKELKLQINREGAQIKIEVNQIIRGCISNPEKLVLCSRAQEIFHAFCAVSVVPHSQLFGGKIIAALDRQHPRDLFDINYLLAENGFNDEIRKGLIFSLLSSNRPVYELLNPNFIDQRHAFETQFDGMSDQEFSYSEFELAREKLVQSIYGVLKKEDKDFIISFKRLKPDWTIYDFEKYPSIQWKLENLRRFKAQNEISYYKSYDRLANFFELI